MSESLTTTKLKGPPIHPGEHLADELEAMGMSANQLAQALNVPANRITRILNGEQAITADTALRLARYLGTSAELWMRLQNTYELRQAELEKGEQITREVAVRAA
jgi:addiction module HigA family antidote